MKNIIVTILFALAVCTGCLAGPRHVRPPVPRPPAHRVCHPAPRHRVVPLVVGAAVGAAIAAICPLYSYRSTMPPVKVWIPGTYVTVMDAFGRPYVRYIPGHWEYR